ncbi:MAG: hypothetical protein JXB43_08435 [Dehalococcoidia bacterium]|nr:hypothetical protein [Dehalococcoidia bacterium]
MKIFGILFALVLAVSFTMPAATFAQDTYDGLDNCSWDTVKWQDNVNSWHLYLQHWGRTPIQAMSRLAGLCGPDTLCAQLGTSCQTPTKSRLYGDPNACLGGCPACRTEEQGALATCSDPVACEASLTSEACPATGQEPYECPTQPAYKEATCCCCWGVSLAFANKSWSAATIGDHPRISDKHLNHKGVSDCYGGNQGGDWGLSGCPHTECCSLTWCLQDNCLASGNCAPKTAVPSVLP